MSPANPAAMADEPPPHRGEVWLVAFDPSIGGEIQKTTKPAVILSNDTVNALLNRVPGGADLQPGRSPLPVRRHMFR
jgi:mRNA-degrading endonuclease toxin of MazEF toxin-antitoxin module